MVQKIKSGWVFIIDTDKYAGNFERELCAYITGRFGDCEVGKEYTDLFNKQSTVNEDFFDNVETRADENGCYRPCSIWETPGWFNNGMGGHFRESDPHADEKALKAYVKEIESTYGGYIKSTLKCKDLSPEEKKRTGWTDAAIKREVKRHEKEIEKARKAKKTQRYPAYNSVAIFFYTKPTEKQIELMKERALKFNEVRKLEYAKRCYGELADNITIEGFRLIQEKTTAEEIKI